ncbi:MAG: ABC transporter permease [Phycisphaerales bacterium]
MTGAPAVAIDDARRQTRRHIPWHMRFPGPVFTKEVWMLGKRPSTAWLRLAHVAVLVFVVAMVFMGMSNSYSSGEGAAGKLQHYQSLAPAVTMAVVWVEFVMLILIGVALAGPAVCDELRMGTLATLLTTPLRTWQIVLGKGMGRLVELMILALVPVPLLLAIRLFGGVTTEAIVTMTVTCIANAMLAVQIGIFTSTVSRRATGAIVLAFLLLGAVMFLPMLTVWATIVIRELTGGMGGRPLGWDLGAMVITCAPMTVFLQSISYLMGESAFGGAPLPVPVLDVWMLHIAYTLGLCVLFFWLSCIALRRALRRDAAPAAPRPARRKTKAAATVLPQDGGADAGPPGVSTGLPAHKRSGRRRVAPEGSSRVVGDSPIMWRELKQGLMGSRTTTVVGGILVAGLLVLVYYLTGFQEPVQQALTAIGAVIAVLAGCVLSTGSISQERESRTLDALLCTPLSAWDIVWAKFAGAARRALVPLGLVMVHVLVAGMGAVPGAALCRIIDTTIPRLSGSRQLDPNTTNPVALFHVLLILGSAMAFQLACGVLFSARFKKSTTATVCNIALGLLLWAALPAVVFISSETLPEPARSVASAARNAVMAINPVPMATIAVDGASHVEYASGGYSSGSKNYDMPDGNWGMMDFSFAMVVVALLYLSGAWGVLRIAARVVGNPTARVR